MACTLRVSPIRSVSVVTSFVLFAFASLAWGYDFQKAINEETVLTLVRVNIIVETRGAKDTVEINGKLVADYSPVIIQDFPSIGIVLDHANHVMTFLGYRWVDIQNSDPRIIITSGEGQKLKGKLIGIDQSNGVAVIRLLEGQLAKTALCIRCDVKDGAIVVTPIMGDPDTSEYREAQILSVGTGSGSLDPGAWTMKLNHSIPDIGLPLLTPDHRVLGYIASQDPMGMQTVVYPISQLLSSAENILKANGDIRTGWLGVFLAISIPVAGPGVTISRVEPDSPAQQAGLAAGDRLLKFNGREIKDAAQFVQLVQNTSIGSKVSLDIIRQGRPKSTTALIEARKPPQNRSKLSFSLTGTFDPTAKDSMPELTPPNPRLLMGLSTEMLTPLLAEALQMPGRTGLLVLSVAPKMAADLAGVLVGDIIISIDGQPILDPLGFASFLQTHAWNAQSVLKVLRKGTERTIIVQIGD